jgi:cyclophilin family peptidyl-prolyl cis-trans isomerase/HEAT repeat protein
VAAPAPARAQPASGPYRAIAIAEDQRRWSDGELRRALAHQEPAVRARAALAVGRLQDSTTVPDLLPLLHDTSAEVRREAAFALGQIGSRAARAPLVTLLADRDTLLVDLAIEALGKLGDRGATPAVAQFLGSGVPLLRGEAAVALWRLADSTALDALIERHSDPDPEVRWRVLYALEKIVAPDRVVLIAALHLDDPEWLVRAYAARTLGRQKSPRGTAYLLQKLADREPAVVVNALRALEQIADSTCVRCASTVLAALSHDHPYVRVTAAPVLGQYAVIAHTDTAVRRAVLDSLAAHLGDRDAATRGACARALLLARGEQALPQIEPLLADSSVTTRVAVLQALTRIPAGRAAPILLARLEADTPLFERMTAAEALGTLKAREAIPVLRAGLADTSALYAASCASAIAELGDTAGVSALANAWAARAGDGDADARTSIRDALRSLAGRAFADSVERAHPAKSAAPASYPADFQDPPAARGAILRTTAGDIEWAFYGSEAPQTVKNFVRLAARGTFDGIAVHRVVPNFVIQDGDPTGTGSGGPGYTIRCEYNRLRYEPGMVGMALSGKDTGGSQWFITHSPQPHLNGRYTIFARVTRGMDVVTRVVQGDRVLRVEILP